MSAFYDDAAQTALDLLTEFGRSRTLRRVSKTYDPVLGGTSAATYVEEGIFAAVFPLSSSARNIQAVGEHFKEDLAAGKVRKVLVAAKDLDFEPGLLDILTLDDGTFIVQGKETLNPAGTPLLYTLIVVQGSVSAVDQAATPAT